MSSHIANRDSNNPPLVSVIIPIYNGGVLLRRTLNSILSQKMQNFEVICINDGSTDGGITDNVLSEYSQKDTRIKVYNQSNSGIAKTCNRALTLSSGTFVIRCDQDDYMHPEELDYCVWASMKYDLDFLAFRYERQKVLGELKMQTVPDYATCPITVCDSTSLSTDPMTYRAAVTSIHLDSWVQFIRLKLAIQVPYSLDVYISRPFMMIRKAKRFAVTPLKLYIYNACNENSISKKPISMEIWEHKRKDMRLLCDIYSDIRNSGDPYGIWEAICRCYIIKQIKIILNNVRRSGGQEDEQIREMKFQQVADIVREFFIWRKIPFRYTALRHRLYYFWLLTKYKNTTYKPPKPVTTGEGW